MQEQIILTTRKQMDIYMNPQRQRLLKTMEIEGRPMTSKQLSGRLGISSSAVSHHIKKLEELGLIELDHMEIIHGIQARFYKKLPLSVSLGGNRDDDLQEERYLLLDYTHSQMWNSYMENLRLHKNSKDIISLGDSMNGVIYLKEEDALKLHQIILDYVEAHNQPGEGTVPWEYSVAAFPHTHTK